MVGRSGGVASSAGAEVTEDEDVTAGAEARAQAKEHPLGWLFSPLRSSLWQPSVVSSGDPWRGKDYRDVDVEERALWGLGQEAPEHLFFLVHGLGGSPGDLKYLKKVLYDKVQGTGSVLVHSCRSNFVNPNNLERLVGLERRRGADEMGTYQGVHAGGAKAAEELLQVVRDFPTLKRLTLVGNSLGGLFARYLAGALWDAKTGTIAGLEPVDYMSIASPHLGTRSYLWQGRFPTWVHEWLTPMWGHSFVQLMYLDGAGPHGHVEGHRRPMFLRMGTEDDADDLPFLAALRAFRRRTCYANCWGDSLVAYESAALDAMPGSTPDPRQFPRGHVGIVREEYLPAGSFEDADGKEDLEADFASLERQFGNGKKEQEALKKAWYEVPLGFEKRVVRGLTRGMGWTRVTCHFPRRLLRSGLADGVLFPSSHNKICANKRNRYYSSTCHEGDAVMQHAAAILTSPPPPADLDAQVLRDVVAVKAVARAKSTPRARQRGTAAAPSEPAPEPTDQGRPKSSRRRR